MSTTGHRIQTLRQERQLSQAALARSLRVSRVSVTKWESRRTENIKHENLLALSKFFGVSVEYLLRGNDRYATHEETPSPVVIASDNVTRTDAACKQPCLPHTLHDSYQMLTEEGQKMVLMQMGIAIETAQRIYGTRGGSSKTVA